MGNTTKQCRLGLFQDSDFAGDLEDSKSTSGGTLCVFGSHTFVPISWMCKKQTAVSHSSTESEIISLDIGLRLDGLPALELWDLIVSVFGSVSQISDRTGQLDGIPALDLWDLIVCPSHNSKTKASKTPILQEILRTQNPLLEEHCVFGSHTFVPISWMCKKQTSVLHSSTESEIISLDAGLRLDGIPALDL